MREEIERRIDAILRILSTRQRLPGYTVLKQERVLPQLRRTLKKIEEGSYGECDDCPETIPEERLLRVPGATRCVSCQSSYEREAGSAPRT